MLREMQCHRHNWRSLGHGHTENVVSFHTKCVAQIHLFSRHAPFILRDAPFMVGSNSNYLQIVLLLAKILFLECVTKGFRSTLEVGDQAWSGWCAGGRFPANCLLWLRFMTCVEVASPVSVASTNCRNMSMLLCRFLVAGATGQDFTSCLKSRGRFAKKKIHFIHIQLWYCVLILVKKSSEIIGISKGLVSTAAEVPTGGSEKKNCEEWRKSSTKCPFRKPYV